MLSKSKFIAGLQCEKRLWLEKFRPELREELTDAQRAVFAQGSSVGRLAQDLFPGGVDCTPDFTRSDGKGITIGLNMTKEAIANKADVIYEAAFVADGVYVATDILLREGNRWRAIEVKSTTSVKGYHINDIAIQYYVLTQAGLDLVDIELMHLDSTYKRDGDIDLNLLFTRTSLGDEVVPLQAEMKENVRLFKEYLQEGEPNIDIGPQCDDPFPCPFKSHCWKDVPEQSVFDLTRIGSNAWRMYEAGIVSIDEIPDNAALTPKQRNQVKGIREGAEVFKADVISEFLNRWEYPLYFFDFETVNPAVPLYDRSRPYEQIPFQYSLHIVEKPGAEATHKEFLADPAAGDPRPALIAQMLKDLGTKGSIVTYNMGFEKGKIEALAEAFYKFEEALLAVNERVVDLLIPFRSHWCYKPAMDGSASIKSVLPAMTDLSYDDLEIKEGAAASATWLAMAENRYTGQAEEHMKQLRKYCERDTWAMVVLWKELQTLSSAKG